MSKSDEKCKCGCGQELGDEVDIETNKTCQCSGDCDCGDDCHCSEDDKCNPNCTCGSNCKCGDDCSCGEDCECDDNCSCSDECDCEKDCKCGDNKNYLNDLLRVQAEFDNYRKRMISALSDARKDGFMDAIEGFLPALDSFKMATEYIQDKNTLMGIKYIEKGILDTLAKMGVQEIEATGEFNPELHQAVDTDSSADVPSNHIVKEVAKGFKYKDKVIRYSQVIVKK